MTKKRFKKILMSLGYQRNSVDIIDRILQAKRPSCKVIAGVGWVTPEMREKAEFVLPFIGSEILVSIEEKLVP